MRAWGVCDKVCEVAIGQGYVAIGNGDVEFAGDFVLAHVRMGL